MSDDKKRPAKRPGSGLAKPTAGGKQSAFLAKVRAAKAAPPVAVAPRAHAKAAHIEAALRPRAGRPRLVFAIDATASRQPAWEAARTTTDALFQALPGQLDVALAVHGGSRVKLFTEFVSEPAALRDQASSVRCEAGMTRLVEIMERCRDASDVKVLVYIGDVFEEGLEEAEQAATALRLRGTRVIVLHDRAQALQLDASAEAFQRIAQFTQGAVLPFDPSAVTALRALLEAVATLAVGGIKLLQERRSALPAASLLLGLLSDGSES
jgi:hypothetical protein